MFTMKKMKKIVSAVLCAFLFGLVDSMGSYFKFPPSGPKLPGETGKYVYTDGANSKHCLYCPGDAFESTAKNKKMQEYLCINNYDNISAEITPFELKNNKIPVCKVGEVPGCGPPPEEKKTADYVWYCDPGYSNVTYSVYFSCILKHKHTQVVTWSYYCNESLKWVLDSNLSVGQSAVTTTQKGPTGDSAIFKIMVITACIVVTLLVGLLAAMTYCLWRKRHQNDSLASEDDEASKTLVVKQPSPSRQSNCIAGTETSTSTEGSVSECDVTELMNAGVEKTNEMSNGRLPPYGQEEHKHTIGCQTMTDLGNSPTVSLQSNPGNLNSLASTCRYPLPSDSSGGNQNTHMSTVRAEFQSSISSNPLTRRCPVHQRQNPPSEIDGTKQSVLEMKPVDFKECSSNINNLNQGQDREHSKDSRIDRPNPPGRSSNNTCAESGFFDDENDKRHNTALKQRVNESVTEYPECSNCEHVRHQQSQHGDKNINSAEQQRTARCICTSISTSFEIENESEERLIHDHQETLEGDESFEIEPHQLKFL